MMDLDDGVESTPGMTDTHPGRSLAPFLGATTTTHHPHLTPIATTNATTALPAPPQPQQQTPPDKQLQQQQQQVQQQHQQQIQLQNGYTQSAISVTSSGNIQTHRHNNALAVSIETDV